MKKERDTEETQLGEIRASETRGRKTRPTKKFPAYFLSEGQPGYLVQNDFLIVLLEVKAMASISRIWLDTVFQRY